MRKDIELLRIISAFAIVWFHCKVVYFREASYGGLIFFVIVSMYFSTVSIKQKKHQDRIKRFILPCVVWSIFYGVLRFMAQGSVLRQDLGLIGGLLSTPARHLWYLPYMYINLSLLDRAKIIFSKKDIGIFSGIFAIILMLLSPIWRSVEYLSPFSHYSHALPAVFIGIYLGYFSQIKSKLRLVILIGIIMSILLMTYISQQNIGITYLVGTLPCLLLLRSDLLSKMKISIYPISSLMFGIYLVYFFSLKFIYRFFPNIEHASPEQALTCFFLSAIIIFFLKQILPKKFHFLIV